VVRHFLDEIKHMAHGFTSGLDVFEGVPLALLFLEFYVSALRRSRSSAFFRVRRTSSVLKGL